MPAGEAAELIQRITKVDPRFDLKLAGALGRPGPDDLPERCLHILAVLERVSECRRLRPYLAALCDHPNARVRSKAVAMLTRCNSGFGAAINPAQDPDRRVRANAVEALLGVESQEARRVMRAYSGDPHHRVATTALAGLHMLGEADAAGRLETMLRFGECAQRAAAAWAMGRTGDPAFLGTLQAALPGSSGIVRQNILRAMVRLRSQATAAAPASEPAGVSS